MGGRVAPRDRRRAALMALFESMLVLLMLAIVLLQLSRRLAVPYPTMLALAGVVVAALPWAPEIGIDPHLALALFIAPALLDAAFDLAPRTLLAYWLPLLALAAGAVVVTTAAVALVGTAVAGLPIAAAIALGAIVAPPDAAAASAMLGRFPLPRRTVTVLKGESLLNDASALLIFAVAVAAARTPDAVSGLLPAIAVAVPGGILLGIVAGRLAIWLLRWVSGTLGGTIAEFVSTFGVWIIAERLHLSAILAVVAYGMTLGRWIPERTPGRVRMHSYAVWETVVFLLNVLAFLLMGLQAREIVGRLAPDALWQALGLAVLVVGVVILVRIAWVMPYIWAARTASVRRGGPAVPTTKQGIVVSWCGMRGLVTLATALALPLDFPGRDLIVLSALAVVLGTLVLQGLTLGPLIRRLGFPPDGALQQDLSTVRLALIDAATAVLDGREDPVAAQLRQEHAEARAIIAAGDNPRAVSARDALRRECLAAKRRALADLRRRGRIDDDVFHAVEQELDWSELGTLAPDRNEILEG
jgi:CPA1 family monovalent cation:H+ antiporter